LLLTITLFAAILLALAVALALPALRLPTSVAIFSFAAAGTIGPRLLCLALLTAFALLAAFTLLSCTLLSCTLPTAWLSAAATLSRGAAPLSRRGVTTCLPALPLRRSTLLVFARLRLLAALLAAARRTVLLPRLGLALLAAVLLRLVLLLLWRLLLRIFLLQTARSLGALLVPLVRALGTSRLGLATCGLFTR